MVGEVGEFFTGFYDSFFTNTNLAFNVLFLALVLVVASLFIWQFYRSTSRRNLIELDLKRYNNVSHPLEGKLFAVFLYFVEYIIIMPLLIIFWFAGLFFVLVLIAKQRTLGEVLFISAALITAIRILAYYNGEISKELGKLFPFITLSVFLLSPGDFNFIGSLNTLTSLADSFRNILSYILVIFAVEIVLRFIYTIYAFWESEEDLLTEKGNKDTEG